MDVEMDTKRCDDCKGSGEYRGLNVVEPCQSCGGTGKVFVAPGTMRPFTDPGNTGWIGLGQPIPEEPNAQNLIKNFGGNPEPEQTLLVTGTEETEIFGERGFREGDFNGMRIQRYPTTTFMVLDNVECNLSELRRLDWEKKVKIRLKIRLDTLDFYCECYAYIKSVDPIPGPFISRVKVKLEVVNF